MKPPFDICADLDTPVSAYLKLAPFRPRFLLESVEGGERLARYSFIGFGECLEVRLDASGLAIGGVHTPRPQSKSELLNALRHALSLAPQPQPEVPGVPLLGGYVQDAREKLVRPDCERNRRWFPEADLFEPGYAVLTAQGRQHLDEVAPWLLGLKHAGAQATDTVLTRGHPAQTEQ